MARPRYDRESNPCQHLDEFLTVRGIVESGNDFRSDRRSIKACTFDLCSNRRRHGQGNLARSPWRLAILERFHHVR